MIDTTKLGELTAQVMDALQRYDEDVWKVGTVAVVVELDSERTGELIVKCSETRAWIMEAFLGEAYDCVHELRQGESVREEDG